MGNVPRQDLNRHLPSHSPLCAIPHEWGPAFQRRVPPVLRLDHFPLALAQDTAHKLARNYAYKLVRKVRSFKSQCILRNKLYASIECAVIYADL